MNKSKQVLTVIKEELASPERYITPEFIEYAYKDIEANGKKSQFYTFFRLSQNATDQDLKDMYSYMMMMPPSYARNYIREWTQKSIRNGVISGATLGGADENTGESYSIDFTDIYESPTAGYDTGMFVSLHDHDDRNNPEKLNSVREWMTKFINHPKMTREARIIAIVRLIFGESGGAGRLRNEPLPLNEVVDTLPKEYEVVMDQIDLIRKQNVSFEELNVKMVVCGFEWTDDKGKVIAKAPSLVSQHKFKRAAETVVPVVKDMTNGEAEVKVTEDGLRWDLKEVYTWLNDKHIFESLIDGILSLYPVSIGEAKDRSMIMMQISEALINGSMKVKSKDLITYVVSMVSAHFSLKTELSRSWGSSTIKSISTEYLNMFKSKSVMDRTKALALVISLVIETTKVGTKIRKLQKLIDKRKIK